MKADKPFKKSFACGAALFFIAIIILAALSGGQNLSYRIGYLVPPFLIVIVVTGIWGYFSKKTWSWARFGATVLVLYIGLKLSSAVLRTAAVSQTRGGSDGEQVVEFKRFVEEQQKLAQELDAVSDPASLVQALDKLTGSANQLKSILAKDKQVRATQSAAHEKEAYDAGFEAGKTFAANYRTAADAVPKYNTDPNVVAAWEKLRTTAEPIFK